MTRRRLHIGSVLLLWIAFAATTEAQPVHSFPALAAHLDTGENVTIITADGERTDGEVIAMSSTGLDIDVDGRMVRFDAAQLKEIGLRRDSFVNGTLIGLGTGAAAGFLMGVLISEDAGNLRGLVIMFGGSLGAGIGSGLGFAADALVRRYRVLYSAPRSLVSVSPVVAPGRIRGVAMTLQW